MNEVIAQIPRLPARPRDAHKGLFGRILVIGGSRGMVGAPSLAGRAALRSGAGLVRIAVPGGIQQTVAGLVPCATTIPLAEDTSGRISGKAIPELLAAVEDNDVIAIGPGLGQSNELQGLLEGVLRQGEKPVVLDADGLNNLASLWHEKMQLPAKTILTPHPGEMKRLWAAILREPVPTDRQEQAETLARKLQVVVVLKGAGTVITDGKRTYINTTGNPGMATGGTGDVLTGCIAGVLGQGLAPFEAAVLGVYVHGRAGDLAAAERSEIALIAEDVIDFLPPAWWEISQR
ncbi:MAG: Bifunctional NAD(P)H-hydrate repair enzyme Nnr [Planctomycetes bacterium ADurb.Bin412]|nr:MAG: Bifunctional NAD(P)H-hydrate repair enzyme Nnr [Planctomycetes bacterium ADurb.Bin412]